MAPGNSPISAVVIQLNTFPGLLLYIFSVDSVPVRNSNNTCLGQHVDSEGRIPPAVGSVSC